MEFIAAQIPAKQRAVKINETVERVASKAFEDGLSEASLDKLVDIVTLPNELDQASIANIIRNLYPAAQVSDDSLVKVIGSLGHGQSRVAFPVQSLLLKWVVMVHDSIRNPKILSHAYGFLFNLLDTIAIRSVLHHHSLSPEANGQQSAPMPSLITNYSPKTCETIPHSITVCKCSTYLKPAADTG